MSNLGMAPTRELWTSNLVDSARAIGDTEHQRGRWLASDAFAWERPEELIAMWDDSLVELFIEEYGATLSRVQADAATALRDELNSYCDAAQPGLLDPEQVLADPRWESVRSKARFFVGAFENKPSE